MTTLRFVKLDVAFAEGWEKKENGDYYSKGELIARVAVAFGPTNMTSNLSSALAARIISMAEQEVRAALVAAADASVHGIPTTLQLEG